MIHLTICHKEEILNSVPKAYLICMFILYQRVTVKVF